jgi:hypothetical protein
MVIKRGTSQGVYYNIHGNTNNRILTIEYYGSFYRNGKQLSHFQVLLFEDKPNIVQFIYFDVTDEEEFATVGVKSKQIFHLLYPFISYLDSTGQFIQYSSREPFSLSSNMSITFDTNQNKYTAVRLCGSKTCPMDEPCVQEMCVKRGSLSFVARWSPRKGRGHIIVRTPLNNTIYYGNSRTKSSADEGQHEQIGDGSEVDNIYWPLNSTVPKGFYKICFSTGSLLNGTDKSPLTVTIEIKRFEQPLETKIHIFNKSTTSLDECFDSYDTFIGSYSTGMF